MNTPQPVPQINIDGPRTMALIRALLILGQNCIKNERLDRRSWDLLLQNEAYLKHFDHFVVTVLKCPGPSQQVEKLKAVFQHKMTVAALTQGAEYCLASANSLSVLLQLWTQHAGNVLVASQTAEIGKKVAGDIERIRTTPPKE